MRRRCGGSSTSDGHRTRIACRNFRVARRGKREDRSFHFSDRMSKIVSGEREAKS
jgi:hypothetical protein